MKRVLLVTGAMLSLSLLQSRPAAAVWPSDPAENLPICTAPGNQVPQIVSDGAGGAIITVEDTNAGGVYAQRISAGGDVLWTTCGVAVQPYPLARPQTSPQVVSDGAGGAIVVWIYTGLGGGIIAQRISAAGVRQWGDYAARACGLAGSQAYLSVVTDGAGGAIVAWQDRRNYGSSNYDIYAQRISAMGVAQWAADGVAVCAAPGDQTSPHAVSDDAGGVIISWDDHRSGNHDYYAQRISATGVAQWAADGVPFCTAPGYRWWPEITSDGAGGAIAVWDDYRSGDRDVYAQRISATGAMQWPANVAICTAIGAQWLPQIASDGAGGAVITWYDYRSSTADIYAQRISAEGAVQWATDGVALCTDVNEQSAPRLVSDGTGGAIVAWEDARGATGHDIYAQRISAAGVAQWTADGVAVSTAIRNQAGPLVATDDAGGAIVTWHDDRTGTNIDTYAQRVLADGRISEDAPVPVLISLVSADVTADGVQLRWWAGGMEGGRAIVERCLGGSEWTRIGEVTADGAGYLRYTDPTSATATRLGYRLVVVAAGVEGFYGETWVDLPALDFALQGVPNPSRGGSLTVTFTLPTALSAKLELLDVSGRQVVEREVGRLGAGRHTLDIDASAHLTPGLYLIRLTQGVNKRTTRVVVLR